MNNPKKLPQQIRRRNSARITAVPIGGREGPTPEWPLDTRSESEIRRWERLWAKPQAVIWEAMEMDLEVALYTRLVLQAEEPAASSRLSAEVRQMGDRLLLNPVMMFRCQVQLVDEGGTISAPGVTDLEVYRSMVAIDAEVSA